MAAGWIHPAASQLTSKRSVNITASKAPKIVDSVERINHPEGTNATFSCTIGSGELSGLKFEWLKDDKRIGPASSRHRIAVAPENYNSVLRVIDLKSDDSGVYSCIARNAFGQDKISIRLFVKGEQTFTAAACLHQPTKARED